MLVTGCWFIGRIGINPQRGNRWVITGNWFNTISNDIIENGSANAEMTLTANFFGTGVSFNGATSFQNLVIANNIFSKTGSVTLLDLGAFTSDSTGLTITGNTFLGDASGTGIDLTDAQLVDGLCAHNTFRGFASGSEITTTAIGSNFQIFHNVSDAGALAEYTVLDINHFGGFLNVDEVRFLLEVVCDRQV